ncbi:MAG: type I-F CRISPR-associated protein Cas7f/Csy3, partial [Desulfamplus sp.]|nr:type I-F CRISPR-associated protein Cas7f/Csy3 [Desulfamplus sp.]
MAKKTNTEKQEKITIPLVLSFEKKLVPSNGYMFGTTWDKRNNIGEPLKIVEEAKLGTKSSANETAVAEANPQRVDNCSLKFDQDTLQLQFTLKILSGIEKPSICSTPAFLKAYKDIVNNYIEKEGFRELAKRYATNIANGRFLWRNRVGAENI